MTSLSGERSQTQEVLAQLGDLGVHRVLEVRASEPLFEGNYRAKIELLARVALS
jgi:hypothetical protein